MEKRYIAYRKTKAEIAVLDDAFLKIVAANQPVTVRQTYYLAVAAGVIDKTDKAYFNVSHRLTLLRRAKRLPYTSIADNTRWMRKPRTFNSIDEALENCRDTYRKAVWSNVDAYVEVWCEKDALAGVLLEETDPYDVPLMVSRGFSSESYLYGAAEQIRAANRPAYIYYFGDYDPSGLIIPQSIERRLRSFIPDVDLTFTRVAVNPDQIRDLKLPTRPTKLGGSHAKSFSVKPRSTSTRYHRAPYDACVAKSSSGTFRDSTCTRSK